MANGARVLVVVFLLGCVTGIPLEHSLCSSGGCSHHLEGAVRAPATTAVAAAEVPPLSPSRAKRCSFGGCGVNIGGSNSGNINMLANGASDKPTAGQEPISLLTEPVQQSSDLTASEDALLTRNKRCSFGGCRINIGGNNSGDIKMLTEDRRAKANTQKTN